MNEFNMNVTSASMIEELQKQAQKRKAEQEALPRKQIEELEKQTSIISCLKKITELNIKSSQDYNEASKRSAESSLNLSKNAIRISIAVGAISIIMGVVSIGVGIASFKSSNAWQGQQIPEIKAQNLKLEEQNKLLKQINESLKAKPEKEIKLDKTKKNFKEHNNG